MDEETGLAYYGARYYDNQISQWLSVDAMASDYPSFSPYNFVLNNPISLTDPNGMWVEDGDGNWVAEKGDSWWTFHEQTGMSWDETKQFAKDYNSARGNDNWKSVYEGDVASLSGGSAPSAPSEGLGYAYSGADLSQGGSSEQFGVAGLSLGMTGSILETSSSTFRLSTTTRGFSPKLYSSGWTGNQYASTYRISNVGRVLGYGSFVGGVAMDAYGVHSYYTDGPNAAGAVHPARGATNTAVGAYGLWGGFSGSITAPLYFGVEYFYPGGWLGNGSDPGAFNDVATRDARTSSIMSSGGNRVIFNSMNQSLRGGNFKW